MLGTIGALGYTKVGPVPYQSTVQVMVAAPTDATSDTIGSPRTLRDAATNFAAQAASTQVLSLVSGALQGKMSLSTGELMAMQREGKLGVRPQSGSSFVEITVQESSPAEARLLATTMADEFVKEVNQRAAEAVATRQKQLERQIEVAREELMTAQLYQREIDLVKDLRAQRAQLLQLQSNYQQELAREATIDRLALSDAAAAPPGSAPAGDRQPAQLTDAAARVASQSMKVLTEQQKEQEAAVATLNGQLDAVRAALRKAPTAELRQREQELSTQLQAQRAQLLQSNQAYQQELQRLAATDQGRLTPSQERQRQGLAEASAKVRNDWLRVIEDQQRDVTTNIAELEQQLSDVRVALQTRAGNGDQVVQAAFAQAYSQRLLALTQDYTRLQMNLQATTSPVSRYGEASPPVAITSMKKVLPMGTGGGLALGAGVALLLHLRERRRTRQDGADEPPTGRAEQLRPVAEPATPKRAPSPRAAALRPTSSLELGRLQRLYRDSQLQEPPPAGQARRWPAP